MPIALGVKKPAYTEEEKRRTMPRGATFVLGDVASRKPTACFLYLAHGGFLSNRLEQACEEETTKVTRRGHEENHALFS